VDDEEEGPRFLFLFLTAVVTLADGIDTVEENVREEETNADADLAAAWLNLQRRSMNAAMITAGKMRIDAISPP